MDEIVVKDNGIEVVAAPRRAHISLDLLVVNHDRGLAVHGNLIVVGTYPHSVFYRVVGWNTAAAALEVEREN